MQNVRNHYNENTGSATSYDNDVVFITQFSNPVLQKPPKLKPRILRPKPSLPSNIIASNKSINAIETLDPLDPSILKPIIIRPKPSLPSNIIASNKSVNAIETLDPLDRSILKPRIIRSKPSLPSNTIAYNKSINAVEILDPLDPSIKSILKPRIIRPKPSVPSNTIPSNKSVNAVGTLVPLDAARLYQMEVVDCSNNGNARVYILDQSDFVPLLENSEALVGGRKAIGSTENIEEILVDSNQVQLLNEPNKQSEYGRNSICRTCLTLTDIKNCKKIFDSKDREDSNNLREKLVYIADKINYKASFNPTICQKCITLIEIAYNFKKQVREVEDRIRKKLNENKGNLFVDLRCFLEGNANAETGSDCHRKNTEQTQREGRIVNSQEVIVVDDDEKDTKSDNVPQHKSIYHNVEEYLRARGKRLDRIRQYAKIYEQQVIMPAKIVTIQDDPQITNLPNSEAALEVNSETVAVAVSAGDDESTGPATNFETYLARRQDRVKKFDYTNQFSNSNVRVLKYQKRPFNQEPILTADKEQVEKTKSPAYKFLFNTHQIKKKKPEVPKTWNLFDEEHDKYFKNLIGETGCLMVRKWSRFIKRYHINRWHTTSEGPFLCDYCGLIFPSRAKFSQHIGLHSFKKEMCSYCGKLVKGGRHLKYHVEAKHLPPSYECNHCGKKFHLSANLGTHILKMHKGGTYTVQCQVCGKLLMSSTLKIHMARLHNQSGQRFTCEVCGRSWSCKYDLFKHRKRHTSSEWCNCPLCPKTFTCKKNLKRHILQFHKGLPKLKCMICDKSLGREDSLKIHLRVKHNTIFMNGELTKTASKKGECNKSVTSSSVIEAESTIKEQAECEIACESIVDEARSSMIEAESTIIEQAECDIASESIVDEARSSMIEAESTIKEQAECEIACESIVDEARSSMIEAESTIIEQAECEIACESIVDEALSLMIEAESTIIEQAECEIACESIVDEALSSMIEAESTIIEQAECEIACESIVDEAP